MKTNQAAAGQSASTGSVKHVDRNTRREGQAPPVGRPSPRLSLPSTELVAEFADDSDNGLSGWTVIARRTLVLLACLVALVHTRATPNDANNLRPRGSNSPTSPHGRRLNFVDPKTVEARTPQVLKPEEQAFSGTTFTIVILTMNRLASLQRLVQSLLHPNCDYDKFGGMTIDLVFHIDRPKNDDDEMWLQTIRWTENEVSWPHGRVVSLVANENMGLRKAWLEAWHPSSETDRAIILEDDITVSPLWFRWVNAAYDVYSNNDRVAGFSLQRQDLVPSSTRKHGVPTNNNEPFLYSLIGSIGFAPNARIWADFVEWANCAIEHEVDVYVDGLVTSEWWRKLDHRGMWTQHMIYYMNENNLYCLYQFPSDDTQVLALHWKEKGEHFHGKSVKPSQDLVVDSQKIGDFMFPPIPNHYDWGANLVAVPPQPTTLLISAAVGYSEGVYLKFVSTLRRYYSGDVILLVEKDPKPEILSLLKANNIFFHEYEGHMADSWEGFNIERFGFYTKACENYDYCLAMDFRDSIFQGDPFASFSMDPSLMNYDLIVQTHDARFGDDQGVTEFHNKMILACADSNKELADKYMSCLNGNDLINGGGMIGNPSSFQKLESIVSEVAREGCSDQMAMNIGVHCHLHDLMSVKVYRQGHGPINTVGWGGKFFMFGGTVRNLDCRISPVVHQTKWVNFGVPLPPPQPVFQPANDVMSTFASEASGRS